MLPPIVMLTIDAASPQKPTARVSVDGLGLLFSVASSSVERSASSGTGRGPAFPGWTTGLRVTLLLHHPRAGARVLRLQNLRARRSATLLQRCHRQTTHCTRQCSTYVTAHRSAWGARVHDSRDGGR